LFVGQGGGKDIGYLLQERELYEKSKESPSFGKKKTPISPIKEGE